MDDLAALRDAAGGGEVPLFRLRPGISGDVISGGRSIVLNYDPRASD